jgi:hypothetical protein
MRETPEVKRVGKSLAILSLCNSFFPLINFESSDNFKVFTILISEL